MKLITYVPRGITPLAQPISDFMNFQNIVLRDIVRSFGIPARIFNGGNHGSNRHECEAVLEQWNSRRSGLGANRSHVASNDAS